MWLFTYSDSVLVVLHWTIFGMFHALTGSLLTQNQHLALSTVISRLPCAFLWMWLNTLTFNISNQMQPSSIIEDSIDKAWRPLPSKRLNITQARRFLLLTVIVILMLDMYLGALEVTFVWLVLNWTYNDLRGADEHFVVRNALNAIGLCCGCAGTAMIACDGFTFNRTGYNWLAIEGLVVFTTAHVQDLRDQAGDRASGRSTVPLIWGDQYARCSIAFPVFAWSLISPAIWGLGIGHYLAPMLLATIIFYRLLNFRHLQADKLTYKIWSLWIGTIFVLPLCKDSSILYNTI